MPGLPLPLPLPLPPPPPPAGRGVLVRRARPSYTPDP